MALIHCSMGSDALGMTTDFHVVLPEATQDIRNKNQLFPTLYLLHGASDNYSNWVRFTSIERYAQERKIAVIMPEAGLSFYNNMPNGYAYYTFISEELPAYTRVLFPLSRKREDTYVAGLSMGGYGAVRIGLSNPEKFAAIGTFSGAVDITSMSNTEVGFMEETATQDMMERAFGVRNTELMKGTDSDPSALLKRFQDRPQEMPKIYQSCGTKDFLYIQNQTFRKTAEKYGLPVCYEEWEGDHNWPFWNESIQRFFDWIGEKEVYQYGMDTM